MSTKIIPIGYADVQEAEAALNEELKKIEGAESFDTFNDGFNTKLMVFTQETTAGESADEAVDDGDGDDDPVTTTTLTAKLVQFSTIDEAEAEKTINKALEGVTVLFKRIIDGNRLLVLFNVTEEAESDADEGDEG